MILGYVFFLILSAASEFAPLEVEAMMLSQKFATWAECDKAVKETVKTVEELGYKIKSAGCAGEKAQEV